jgi:hypothetical protein
VLGCWLALMLQGLMAALPGQLLSQQRRQQQWWCMHARSRVGSVPHRLPKRQLQQGSRCPQRAPTQHAV